MEEDQGEDEDSSHHAEGGGVVGVSLPNEPLVLVVAERDHRDLKVGDLSKINSPHIVPVCCDLISSRETGESNSIVVHLELVHSICVRDLDA